MNHYYSSMNENQAIEDILSKIKAFKSEHGTPALKDAINNGAFTFHPEYGDVTYIFKHREYDHDEISIPVWIHDLYSDLENEDLY